MEEREQKKISTVEPRFVDDFKVKVFSEKGGLGSTTTHPSPSSILQKTPQKLFENNAISSEMVQIRC
jgi:hypothetical protein